MQNEVHQDQQPVTQVRFDIHQTVTDTIIRQLEAGTVPWQKPWTSGSESPFTLPFNIRTQKPYQGINILLLWSASIDKEYGCSEWASLKQWNSKNETIKADEKGTMIVYWDTFEKEVDGEIKKIPFLKYSKVFNRCQLKSYQPGEAQPELSKPLFERLDKVDDFIANTKAVIKHKGKRACFVPSADEIHMPKPELFIDTEQCSAKENYYSVLSHELMHWTGHPKRLERKFGKRFGDLPYATEELVAELGAAFLCAELEITAAPKPDHASYIKHWLDVLKQNKYALIGSAAIASKAVDYLHHLQPSK